MITPISIEKNTTKFLMNNAWDMFPAQELWVNGKDFVAFSNETGVLQITVGEIDENNCEFETFDLPLEDLDDLLEMYSDHGYECVASQLIV